jgi:uncharacterized membrane-anchored protein
MGRFRRNLLLAGVGGLLASLLLAAVSTWIATSGILIPPFPYRVVTLLLIVVLGGFSLAEIPMMIFVMRRLSAERPDNHRVVVGLNALYVLFATVYGVPVILLTGSVGWGLALCALSVVRFVTSLAFVQEPAS